MKLSEAIRLGAVLRPQGFHRLLRDGRTCALGAAGEAVGVVMRDASSSFNDLDQYNAIIERFPLLNRDAPRPPGEPHYLEATDNCIRVIIANLNDLRGWTREQIADWVEAIEAQQPAALANSTGTESEREVNELVAK